MNSDRIRSLENPAPRRSGGRRRAQPASGTPYRFVLRLVGIPIVAIAAVFLYRGARDHFFLPACDSASARATLSRVLKELKLEPLRYPPIKTISSNRNAVVCSAVMPLPDGASVVANFTFYWQGDKPSMDYSVHREARRRSAAGGAPGA